jgi:hypothetical protein
MAAIRSRWFAKGRRPSHRICPVAKINGPLAGGLLTVARRRAFDFREEVGILLDQVRARWLLSIMADGKKGMDRVTFGRGYDVCIMGIDGTWRRDCLLQAISDTDALLTVEGSIQGLNLKEFFLLLSSTGLAYRRCELVRVNGSEMDIQFLKTKGRKKKPAHA